MSSFPARYFPGILPRRKATEPSVSNSVYSVVADSAPAEASDECNDEALLLRLQKGDVEALGVLYRRYARLVYWVCCRIIRDSGEAQDLVHEVFLCLYRKCRTFDPTKGSARPWIIQLAYSKCFDWRDHLIRRRAHESDIEASETRAKAFSRHDAFDPAYLVLWSHGMLEAFKSLSPDQRLALDLFFFHGYTFEEIAAKLGSSYGNAKHHVYRGIERLRSFVFEGAPQRNSFGVSRGMVCELREVAE